SANSARHEAGLQGRPSGQPSRPTHGIRSGVGRVICQSIRYAGKPARSLFDRPAEDRIMPSRYRLRIAIPIAALLIVAQAAPSWAGGPLGHRVVGRLAERQLTPQARAAVKELFEPGESMADASTWADGQRRAIKGRGNWHYVDVPLDQDRYD